MRRLLVLLVCLFAFASNAINVSANESEQGKISKTLAMNHPANWAHEEMHGKYVETYGSSICKRCHGQDLLGRGAAPSCIGCHTKIATEQEHDD